MSIARLNGRMQLCCDSCPASYPNAYAADEFDVMIADAKTAGWSIRKARQAASERDTTDLFGGKPRVAGAKRHDPYVHSCPSCVAPTESAGLF